MTESPGERVKREHAADMDAFNPAHAVITQVGRWKYSIHISHGISRIQNEFGGPHRYGLERAKKYGERMLAKYLRDVQRRRNVTEIR